MRLSQDLYGTSDPGAETAPMAALLPDAVGAQPHVVAPAPTRLQRLGQLTQVLYHVIAIFVLLSSLLAGVAMHFGWFDPWIAQGTQHIVGSGPTQPPRMVTQTAAPPFGTPLAQDTFGRPDQTFWGTASDGMRWGGDANRAAVFAVGGGVGVISGRAGFFDALLGPPVSNEEVLASVSASRFAGGLVNFGVVVRWSDPNDYYKAYLDGRALVFMKRLAGTSTVLATVPFPAQEGITYSLRLRASGSELFARAWTSGSPEPVSWMIITTDSSLVSGFGGLRVLLDAGVTLHVRGFEALK
jgi:hypothetical protein